MTSDSTPEEPAMRFDDDKDRPTHLVRTPPGFDGLAVRYEVSDEFVDQAIAEIKDLLPEGMNPIVGSIDAPTVEEWGAAMDEHREETVEDPLAEYATALARQAHEQSTGTDLDGEALDVVDADEDDAPKKAKPRKATKKAAAKQPASTS